jgi:hypothetical protein
MAPSSHTIWAWSDNEIRKSGALRELSAATKSVKTILGVDPVVHEETFI